MAECTHPLHERLLALADPATVEHHPFCGAHPAMDDGPCTCPHGVLAGLIGALVAIHHPRESSSVNTLSCDKHNVTKGPPAWRDDPDYEGCPDCIVIPITVCSSWGCEAYPCETITAVDSTLRVAV